MRGALTKPLLVVRGYPSPGLTTSSSSSSSGSGSSSGCHHVGHEVAGREEGGNHLTALLGLLARQLARGELADILRHLSGLEEQYSVPAGAGQHQKLTENKKR